MPLEYPDLQTGGAAKKVPTSRLTLFYTFAGLLLISAAALAAAATIMVRWSKVQAIRYPTPITPITSSESELYIGLWNICIEMEDRLDVEHCSDYDLIGSYDNGKCKDYVVVVKATIIAGAALALLAGLLSLILAAKSKTEIAKVSILGLNILLALLAFGALLTAFICWIVVAEESCGGAGPFKGYSTSWILAIIASACAITAIVPLLVALLSLKKMGKYPVMYPTADPAANYSSPGNATVDLTYPVLTPSPATGLSSPPPSFITYPSMDAIVAPPGPSFNDPIVPQGPLYPKVTPF